MLRIVLELHHIDVTVRAQHQLALRTAPHPPDMLHRQNRQVSSLAFRILYRILSAPAEMICKKQLQASSFQLLAGTSATLTIFRNPAVVPFPARESWKLETES
jgi:hypothetical protein